MVIDILQYLDYRKFLNDYVEQSRSQRSHYSLRYIAMRLGVDASNLVKIIQGARHLPLKFIPRVIEVCSLDAHQERYFRTLVQFNRTKSEKKSQSLFDELMTLQGPHLLSLEVAQYEILRQWYHGAIYALLDFVQPISDWGELGAQLNPAIPAEKARESVNLLIQIGMLQIDADGRLVHQKPLFTTGNHFRNLAIRSFQHQTLDLAKKALDYTNPAQREISTVTFTVSPSDLSEIKLLMKTFRQQVLQIVERSTQSEVVYQLNMQMFPLSHPQKKVKIK